MLLSGSSTRGARGQSPNRSRGSRSGRGTGRGASTSSGTPSANTLNTFEQERLENSAKREQRGRGQNGVATNGRGKHYPRSNNQVRFANPMATEKKESTPSRSSSPATMNPFATTDLSNSNKPSSASIANPFAPSGVSHQFANTSTSHSAGSQTPSAVNPFARPSPSEDVATNRASNFFGAPSAPLSNPFGGVQIQTSDSSDSKFGSQPRNMTFAAPSTTTFSSAFSSSQPQTNGALGSSVDFAAPSNQATTTNFGAPSKSFFPSFPSSSSVHAPSISFGSPSPATGATTFGSISSEPKINSFLPNSTNAQVKAFENSAQSTIPASSTALADKIDQLLRKESIIAPKWPTSTPGDPKQKGAIEAFWQTSKKYRQKVRTSLMTAGLLDDPDKPKKLSEAIDFKGTCEDMCPEFERITRIMEHDVREPEKELRPDGSLWPSPPKMIKALARSAAGQDAPLPMDVRSPAALRRTLDYLVHEVLGDEESRLPSVHGFLWDRTRAIRRDFVFQSSMNPSELGDQVYCLERITRFHVIALHQMSKEGVEAEDFSEQQEVEQLGKALLSLIHAYEDCQAQGIHCENEPEFRAYYVLFNSHNTGILETVQDWGWRFWAESEEIKIAVSLVETLQNTWDSRGPLRPHAATDIAQNAYSRFFSIIEDKKTSYTMACFAEIHFNEVRKSALKAIYAAYRLQRPRTKDWTLHRLNTYLRFDKEEDIIPFVEAYGLHFDTTGEVYLSFDSDDTISDPFPILKQPHSSFLVERKRRDHSLPEVIDITVYDEEEPDNELEDGPGRDSSANELFVKDDNPETDSGASAVQPHVVINSEDEIVGTRQEQGNATQSTPPMGSAPKSTSIFDQIPTPKAFPTDFFSQKSTVAPGPVRSNKETLSSPSTTFGMPPIQVSEPPKSMFSFSQQPQIQTSLPPPLGSPRVTTVISNDNPKPVFDLGAPKVTDPLGGFLGSSFNMGSPPVTAPFSDSLEPRLAMSNYPVTSSSQPSMANTPAAQEGTVSLSKDESPVPLSQSSLSTGPHTVISSPTPHIPLGMPTFSPAPPPTPAKPSTLSSISPAAKSSTLERKKARLDMFSKWVALGDGGLIDQFTEFMVENLLVETVETYVKNEAERVAREAEESACRAADEFRYGFLAKKYCQKWRTLAHRMWLRRKGKKARDARKLFAESLRASKAAESANFVNEFGASTTKVRRNSLESLIDSPGILNGVKESNKQTPALMQIERPKPSRKRQTPKDSTNSLASTTSTHRRGSSGNPLRRSILSDPSYLTGGSRIHLMSNYSARDEKRKQVSGVQTDYFRLKARGITTLPDGTPLANTVANTVLRQKRSFDAAGDALTPTPSKPHEIPRSVPNNAGVRHDGRRTTVEREEDIQALKSRAKDIMAEDKTARQQKSKRSLEGDEEELFERAKRVREQLDEGAGWYRKQIDRDTGSRSMS